MLKEQWQQAEKTRAGKGSPPAGPTSENHPASMSRTEIESHSLVILFVLILDLSTSVISKKNEIVSAYKRLLEGIGDDTVAATMVRHSLVTFSSEVKATPYTPIRDCRPIELEFGGDTCLWGATERTCSMIVEEKKQLEMAGRQVFRTLAILISDMDATDQPGTVPGFIHSTERDHRMNLFPIVVGKDIDWEVANRLSCKRKAALLDETKLEEFFGWMTKSVLLASRSKPGEAFSVPTPTWIKCD